MMKKKNGFTLAEVLITLTIIGVVATLTLPALITNVGEQQAKTGIKKAVNTLSEAAQMSEAIGGFGFNSLKTDLTELDANSAESQTMTGLLMSRVSLDMGKSKIAGQTGAAATYLIGQNAGQAQSAIIAKMTSPNVAFLRDGGAIVYVPGDTLTTTGVGGNSERLNDGLPLGFTIIYDINGEKGPNALSNCDGASNPAADNGYTYKITKAQLNSTIDADTCTTDKSKRMMKDQFLLQVRGSVIQPAHPAAIWASSN